MNDIGVGEGKGLIERKERSLVRLRSVRDEKSRENVLSEDVGDCESMTWLLQRVNLRDLLVMPDDRLPQISSQSRRNRVRDWTEQVEQT